ncbi:Nuclear segregation protein BFR1 [Candida viswanathii]|jgi:chromosome segregation ATPase|uniref:Nuclear segregation protein BFR1 n=1 Tax=Candida viswanathii TaxID=5486 RepID=A0A367Y0U1_9ASCO|nr:Nuclear segregation protein BFR1 [Candida viswanathii]
MAPSATTAGTSSSASASSAPNRKFIKRPDDKAIKEEIDKLKNDIKKLDLTNNEINAQIAKAQIDQKVMDKRNKLQAELKTLIAKQSQGKNERQTINDQIKAIDSTMKKRIAEIQQQTSKNNFKNVAEIDARINSLDSLIDAGNLKLADERRYVKEMSSLRKLRKDFGSIEKTQALIDQDKEKIADLKKKLSATHNKEVQAKFEEIQKELDAINDSNKTIISKRNELYDKRTEIKKEKDAKYDEIRKIRSEFDEKFAHFKQQLAEEKKRRDEEYKQKLEEEKQQKKRERAEKELAEASIPAFTEEINSIHNLLSYFDPSYVKPAKRSEASTLPTNTNLRKIDFPEDVVIIKKEQESFFAGSKGKKAKAKKQTKPKNFTVAPDVVVALSDLAIPFPTKEEEVEETVKTLKETLTALEEKQEEQTKANIERAKERIAKLKDAEEDEDEEEQAEEEQEQDAE